MKNGESNSGETIQLFSDIVRNMQSGLYVYQLEDPCDDRTLRLTIANPASTTALGLSEEEVLGRYIDEIFPNLRKHGIPQKFCEVIRTGKPVSMDDFAYEDDSVASGYFSFRAFPIPGDKVGVLFEDTTARKRTEEALRLREIAIESSISGMCIADLNGTPTYVNPALLKMWGYDSSDEVLGRRAFDFWSNPEQIKAILEECRSGGHWIGEIDATRKDGSTFTVQASTSTIPGSGKPAHIVATFIDITEQKQAQQQLQHAIKLESIGQLAGGVAHDFNNILTGIIGFSELALLDIGPENPLSKELSEIKKLGYRAAELTKQLLAFSRRQPIVQKIIDINELIPDTLKMLQRVIGEDITLQFHPCPCLKSVNADPGQLEQVLMNLAVNSRDAMPNGGTIVIETANVTLKQEFADKRMGLKPGRYAMLSFSDNGCGMDAETREHIFEPFFTTKPVGHGTGLGLSMVYGIVKQHGGNIWTYSEPGVGTTFKIHFPCIEEEQENISDMKCTQQIPRGYETVLLVEDEPTVRMVAERVLTEQGYTVINAESATDAEVLFEQHRERIALVVTDIVMPGGNGVDMYEKLKREKSSLRVLFITGYSDAAIMHTLSVEIMGQLLSKPFSREELLIRVRKVLDA